MAIDLFYPHPEYDFRATERWLEKKARRGWRMIPGGNLSHLAAFERAEPSQLRYRLVPTGNTGLARADDDPPNAAALELYREMGWEYVANRSTFHIFRTADPNAPEPDTDPRVLAMALKPTVKGAVWNTLFWTLFILSQIFRVPLLETAVSRNEPIWLLLPIPLAISALSRIASCIRLLRYRRACSRGRFPEVKRRLYLPDNVLFAASVTLILLSVFGTQSLANTPPAEIYDNYVVYEGREWPFTIPGAVVTKPDAVSFTTFATRENWSYDGYIVMPDSSQGAIYIDYADFHSELFASIYAWEVDHRTSNLIVHRGTEVYRIYTSVTIEDPESIFFPERSE